jgi:hypothetical protein
MPVARRIEEIRNELTALAEAVPTAQELMQAIVRLLHEEI